ncbi:MAG: DUF3025 domain-containing protein [Brachymonas sp.]
METFDAAALHLQHLQPRLQQVQEALTAALPAHAALNQLQASPLPFVPQSELPKGQAYESFIFEQQCVPTRENLHDVFGGLMWCALPQLKRAMNRLQAGEIARDGAQTKRSALRNAVTVLDESGLLLDAPDSIWLALQTRQWQRALLDLRPLWAQCQLFIVGHGLLEQLSLQPHLGLTAHTLRVDLSAHQGNWDAAACAALDASVLPSLAAGYKPYAPLPVFGIPGWHVDNQQASFYANTQIFRPLPIQPAEPAL